MQANDHQVGGDHYKGSGYQHWDMCADADLRHQESAASKYIARWDLKGKPIEDLEKSVHYVEKLIELESEQRRNPYQRAQAAREIMREYCDENSYTGKKRDALLRLVTWRNSEDLRELVALLLGMITDYNSSNAA